MTISIGDKLPEVDFMEMTSEGPRPRSYKDIFAGKTVVLFAVPGAFTPTCSAQHLPGFIAKYEAFADHGVDEIVCTAVNDVFVMNAWGKQNGAAGKVRMLADGNGVFAARIGLELDASTFGMGQRSQRYSMLVSDGVVSRLNVEKDGAFAVSSADYLLNEMA